MVFISIIIRDYYLAKNLQLLGGGSLKQRLGSAYLSSYSFNDKVTELFLGFIQIYIINWV